MKTHLKNAIAGLEKALVETNDADLRQNIMSAMVLAMRAQKAVLVQDAAVKVTSNVGLRALWVARHA